ncbi:MAG: ABC transporter substrate-binding protein, partial [Actinomycetota bacterium]
MEVFEMRGRSLLFVVVAVLLAAACSPPGGAETAAEDGAVRVGAIYPLTGPSAATGKKTLEGVELAAEIVNEDVKDIDLPLAQGEGLPGLDGAEVQITSADTQS